MKDFIFDTVKAVLPERRLNIMAANLKRNFFFPVSAAAYFCLNILKPSKGYYPAILIAVFSAFFMSAQITSIWNYIAKKEKVIKAVSLLTAIGACWWSSQEIFFIKWSASPELSSLSKNILPDFIGYEKIVFFVSILGASAALYFVYVWVALFWSEMKKIFSEINILKDVRVTEFILYGILLLIIFAVTAVIFSKTTAFYGAETANVIYSGDSATLFKSNNAYLHLNHSENDLRQPLFAVFSLPFMGIPYLISRLISAPLYIRALLMDYVQIIMFFSANFILAKTMKLALINRIFFTVLFSCTYTFMLFTLMMEQYIVAYFWLVLCIHLICENKRSYRISLWGAGGSLTTSLILILFISENSPFKNFKRWLEDMIKFGCEFIALMLVFCRFDVIITILSRIIYLSRFTGKNVPFSSRFYQFTQFITGCFIAPGSGVNFAAKDHVSWQLFLCTKPNYAGIALFIFAVISIILNRDKLISLFSALWIALSIIMLLILGWGTAENGLILYSLYFGWAYFVLLFMLVERIAEKLNFKLLVPIACLISAAAMLMINIPSMIEMIKFAVKFYPLR